MRCRTLTILVLFCFTSVLVASAGDKISPQEMVAKSVEAFGPPDVRMPAEGRQLDCRATWHIIVGGSGALQGEGVLQSRGGKLHLNADFHNTAYPGEDIVYTGEGQPTIRQILPGRRSLLGDFIFSNPAVVRSGLFGGVLSSAWPLFKLESSGAKLMWRGSKKVDGQKLYEFEYQGPKQGDVKIFLYFDPDTNRHVMTEYRMLTPVANSGDITKPAGRDMTTTLQEKFSEFRSVFGMTIPLVWTIRYTQEQGAMQEWQITLLKQKLNIPEDAFVPKS